MATISAGLYLHQQAIFRGDPKGSRSMCVAPPPKCSRSAPHGDNDDDDNESVMIVC